MKLPAELAPESTTILRDRRETEGLTWDLSPLRMEWGTLATFDFAIKGLEHVGGIERKELADFISCVTGERERFERELKRMLGYEFRCVIVESTWQQIENGGWRSKVSPESVIGSVLAWQSMGIPFFFPGGKAAAEKYAAKMLYIVARRRYRELRALVGDSRPAEVSA